MNHELQQQSLFGSMPTQPPQQPTPIERRREAMDAALAHAGELFREAFTEYVIWYLTMHGSATGEDIREAYEKTSNPQPYKWQAAGGVYAKLRREKAIEEIGKRRSKTFGNDLAVIALRKNA